MEEKIRAIFKIIFAEEYHDLIEETKVTTGDAVSHSANAMQDIGGALEDLSMAEGTNQDIVAKLTEAVEQPTKKKFVTHGATQ